MMPTLPSACFEMIQSDFSLRFFKSRLHRPAHPGEACQFLLGAIGWCIAQIKLGFWLRAKCATEDRPTARTRQFIAHGCYAYKGQLDHQWTFTPFLDLASLPYGARQLNAQSSQFQRSRSSPFDTGM